jgi:hypothetical protein
VCVIDPDFLFLTDGVDSDDLAGGDDPPMMKVQEILHRQTDQVIMCQRRMNDAVKKLEHLHWQRLMKYTHSLRKGKFKNMKKPPGPPDVGDKAQKVIHDATQAALPLQALFRGGEAREQTTAHFIKAGDTIKASLIGGATRTSQANTYAIVAP